MLDLFAIFSKGGIMLWYLQTTNNLILPAVNNLIKSVILQERGGNVTFSHDHLALMYRLDNEYDLVFVAAYQQFLQLSYVDKFLTDVQRKFRDVYKDVLTDKNGVICRSFNDFESTYKILLSSAIEADRLDKEKPRQMRTFQESEKSQKSAKELLKDNKKEVKTSPNSKGRKPAQPPSSPSKRATIKSSSPAVEENKTGNGVVPNGLSPVTGENGHPGVSVALRKKLERNAKASDKSPKPGRKIVKGKTPKANREWEMGGKSTEGLDYSAKPPANGTSTGTSAGTSSGTSSGMYDDDRKLVGTLKGNLPDYASPDSGESDSDEEMEEEEVEEAEKPVAKSSGWGMMNFFKGLVGSKKLALDDLKPALEKMEIHLIGKNVAADVAKKICQSVASRLEGQVIGTFKGISGAVKDAMCSACLQILAPRRRVDILRDALDAKAAGKPYVITFCGVNGVGKSTNLAKVAFWLLDNGLKVLIAGCDTFRAGAVEQLRTHVRRLDTLFPGGQVHLFERGYGKDPAGIASEAIQFARRADNLYNVVLVDTAGRMQDNEPLMKSLAKLISVNRPHLVLFVGEALVGNEAVDQLVKFNQALADNSNDETPHLIDGIVLTKFDTIDDKVGAAISMTYITGQPIIFVGTGQTYKDLTNLNAASVVRSLLKP